MTYAKVIADSVTPAGHRLTTMEVRFHRFVLAEFNTHRMFSRNSASSRAIPVDKQLSRVRGDMAEPLDWPREQKGMQGGGPVENVEKARLTWREAGFDAADIAESLAQDGVHKSVTNRLLEPFMWHTVIVTATEWENFFHQRCSPLAQPEIRAVADQMKYAYEQSTPKVLVEGRDNWHLPYIDAEDLMSITGNVGVAPNMYKRVIEIAKKVSAARCARVSYLTHDGVRDLSEDLDLYDRLVSADPPHWSPLEHVATPWIVNVDVLSASGLYFYGESHTEKYGYKTPRPRVGNLLGWRSLRTSLEAVRIS